MEKAIHAASGTFEDAPTGPLHWHDARALTLEGRGWSDAPGPYDRLPPRAEGRVHELDWRFAKHSAGMVVRFITDATEIGARWILKSTDVAMAHMPSTGVSGLDLYVRAGERWSWLAALRPGTLLAEKNEQRLVIGLAPAMREYSLYLPLYNGVTSVEVGVPAGASLSPAPARRGPARPLVFYGTSIPQGGCVSRPGMAYPSIVGRKLDAVTINLGFSGSGRCEPAMVDLLAELDAAVFVVDSLVNMEPAIVEERMAHLVDVFQQKQPRTPLVLVEEAVHPSAYARARTLQTPRSATLQKVFNEKRGRSGGRLFLVPGDVLLGDDGESTVDGIHPTDLGALRMADVLTPFLGRVLAGAAGQGTAGG
jgi:hypothetical protein